MAPEQKLLIIGGGGAWRRRMTDFLSRMNYSVSDAVDTAHAAEYLTRKNSFEAALVLAVPGESEVDESLRKLHSRHPELGLLLLSDGSHQEIALRLVERGTVAHVASLDNSAAILSSLKSLIFQKKLLRQNALCRKKLSQYMGDREKNLQKARELEEIYDSTLENLMTALDLRDVETLGHSRTVAKYTQVLARLIGMTNEDELMNIRKGALLHDIGKIAIPDAILKKTSPLTETEWKKIKRHPSLGFVLIKEIKLVKSVGDIILCHHERYDGTGYPKGLSKDDIPPVARVFALADALDAITSPRPYSRPRDFSEASREILANSGSQFDPEVVRAFRSCPLSRWEKIRYESTKLLPYFEDFREAAI